MRRPPYTSCGTPQSKREAAGARYATGSAEGCAADGPPQTLAANPGAAAAPSHRASFPLWPYQAAAADAATGGAGASQACVASDAASAAAGLGPCAGPALAGALCADPRTAQEPAPDNVDALLLPLRHAPHGSGPTAEAATSPPLPHGAAVPGAQATLQACVIDNGACQGELAGFLAQDLSSPPCSAPGAHAAAAGDPGCGAVGSGCPCQPAQPGAVPAVAAGACAASDLPPAALLAAATPAPAGAPGCAHPKPLTQPGAPKAWRPARSEKERRAAKAAARAAARLPPRRVGARSGHAVPEGEWQVGSALTRL